MPPILLAAWFPTHFGTVVANIALILMHPAGTENRSRLAASDVKADAAIDCCHTADFY